MTIPIERTRAVRNVERFLMKLCNPKEYPRIPKSIRREAAWLLKHYPTGFDLNESAKVLPDTWGPLNEDTRGLARLTFIKLKE